MNVAALHKEYHEEYTRLTEEEKAALVQRHEEQRSEPKIRRHTPHARVADVANTVRNMQMLVSFPLRHILVNNPYLLDDCLGRARWHRGVLHDRP